MNNNIICIRLKYKRASILYYEARLAFTSTGAGGYYGIRFNIIFRNSPVYYTTPAFIT